jgi:DNA repair exonuclease SbcCD nuclease subunit
MSKKFIVFSDQHLEAKLYNLPDLEKDNRQLFTDVINIAVELEVDYLISVGDLFDNNRPSSETITFVSSEVARLKKSGVTPLAIAGDHSKPIDGATWETICGFQSVNIVSEFVGFDYMDNPQEVLRRINNELSVRPRDSVEFIFMHQQIPEIWPFCDEKKKIHLKDIDLGNHCASMKAFFLGDIHKRQDIRYKDIVCGREIFAGYCGSLGVTASDETKKEGLYYWNGQKLELIEYKLPRKFITIDVTKQSLEILTQELFKEYLGVAAKPVFICRVDNGVKIEHKLDFLYDLGHVRFTRVKQTIEGTEEMLNIRSELKTTERLANVLKDLTQPLENNTEVYNAAYSLLVDEDPKRILDNLYATIIEKP